MNVNGKHYHTIWSDANRNIFVIDQRKLPFFFEVIELKTVRELCDAISDMAVRGAPLIGVTGAYGVYLAVKEAKNNTEFQEKVNAIRSTRPTAINLNYAIDFVLNEINGLTTPDEKLNKAFLVAEQIKQLEIDYCRKIGEYGINIIEKIAEKKSGQTVNILTHCNAGWLACVDFGTATAPIYYAHDKGIKVHVWVDETRPRNQGAKLTAWELGMHGVDYTLIADNTGGHLMQHEMVDMVIVGSDRTTIRGDVANKIGTYLKALAAHDNNIPFYVALPSSTIDWNIEDGIQQIPIETRTGDEVKYMEGLSNNEYCKTLICPSNAKIVNYGFDVTPARYVTGLITERGICKANKDDILKLFSEK